jgi:hypothetical protein
MNTNDPLALLERAKEMAAREVLRRGLKGLRAEITERALVDHYHRELVEESRGVTA